MELIDKVEINISKKEVEEIVLMYLREKWNVVGKSISFDLESDPDDFGGYPTQRFKGISGNGIRVT